MASKTIHGSGAINTGNTRGMLGTARATSAGHRSGGSVPDTGGALQGSALSPKIAVNGRMPAGDTGEQHFGAQQAITPREVVPGLGKGAKGQKISPTVRGKVR